MNKKATGFINSLNDWNKKLYGDRKRARTKTFCDILWDSFQIKSWPRFKGACSSHIPDLWREDVIKMIYQVRNGLGNRIEFIQIKEKFCRLVVIFRSKDGEARDIANKLINSCKKSLIEKGLHPKEEKDE